MERQTQRLVHSPKPLALVSVLAISLLLSASQLVPVWSGLAAEELPPALAVPSGQFTAFELVAHGVQIYACQARADDPTAFEWAFRAPEAILLNAADEVVGKHYAGPTWEGLDGSTVVGAVRANVDSPDPGAIPWLLLQSQSRAGAGLFSTVSYVQRLDTGGGRAPADGCGAPTVGQEVRVPYSAIYTFSYPMGATS